MAMPAAKEPHTAESRSVQQQQEQVVQLAQVVTELKDINRHLEGIGRALMEIRDEMKEKEQTLDL